MLPSSTVPNFIEAVTIKERLDDAHGLAERVEADPHDPIAASHLERLYEERGQWDELISILLDRADELGAGPAANEALRKVAEIYERELCDCESALAVVLAAFRRDPTDTNLADSMDQLAYRTHQWEEAIDAYMIAAGELLHTDPDASSDLWLRIACANIVATGDLEAVNEALTRVTRLDVVRAAPYLDMVEHRAQAMPLLTALIEACRRVGDTERQRRTVARALAKSSDLSERAALHHDLALLSEDDDADTVEWHLAEALRLDPRRSGTRAKLVEIYKARKQYRRVAQLLESGRLFAGHGEVAPIAMEAAALYADELEERTRAVSMYAAALADDPNHLGAAIPLCDRYYRRQRWQELSPVVELLITRMHEIPAHRISEAELHFRAGRAAAELGRPVKARYAFAKALDNDPERLDARIAYAHICDSLGDAEEAGRAYGQVLARQRQTGANSDALAETLYRMAVLRRRVGDDEVATTLLESAIDIAYHAPALEALCELFGAEHDYRSMFHAMNRQLGFSSDEDQGRLLCQMASLNATQLGDPMGAIGMYRRAVEIDPSNREALHHLVELHTAAEMWRDAVDTILLMIDAEPDPLRCGKFYQAAGTIARHSLSGEEARAYLSRALDCFFVDSDELPEAMRASCMKAFTDIGKILYAEGEWKELEREYRKMIKRLAPGDAELPELWHGLGQIYRKHLKQKREAISSFEVAAQLDHGRSTHHRILIDLYQDGTADGLDKAIARRETLAAAEPLSVEHYEALSELFAKAGNYDRKWLATRAAVFLGRASGESRRFYERYSPRGVRWPEGRLSADNWKAIASPDEDKHLSAIFALVSQTAALETSTSPRKLGLRDDPSPTFDYLRGIYCGVTHALAVPAVPAVMQPELSSDVLLANLRRGRTLAPAFVVGRSLYEGRSVGAIMHSLARAVSYARPRYYLRLALPTLGELEAVLLAAFSLSRDDVPVPNALAHVVASYRDALAKRLPQSARVQVGQVVDSFVAAGNPYAIDRWAAAVDTTCRRAGLLVSGDLEAAAAAAAHEPQFVCGGSAEAKVADLLVHSVSQAHHEARTQLGLTIADR